MTEENNKPRVAVALSYDGDQAPIVSAKGRDHIAEEIIALAKESGIHIHQDEHLSEFLASLDLGETIPKELYLLIAELIAFVYMLEGKFPEHWTNMHKVIVDQA